MEVCRDKRKRKESVIWLKMPEGGSIVFGFKVKRNKEKNVWT